jgi:PmbA protein
MDMLTALREHTEQAEVYTITQEKTLVGFEANAIKSAKVEEVSGTALRAIVAGRLGFSAASGASAEELTANLLDAARYGDAANFGFPAAAPGPQVRVFDESLAGVSIAQMVEIGREVVATLRAVDGDAQVNVDIERSLAQTTLANSAGARVEERSSAFGVGIEVTRVRGDDVFIAYDGVQDISLSDAYRVAMQRLARQVELAKKSATLRAGRMPVLFSPSGALVLMLPLRLATNGKSVQRGISPLSDKVGQHIFDPRLTLWDDPTLPGRPRSASYDGEGVPCARKALIEAGVCRGFVYDLRTAAQMGTTSTGNGARGLFAPPAPAHANLVLETGDTPLAEIIAGIEYGLLVEDVLGLGQGNAISGAFSTPVGLGYLIERGEIVGRVKDVSIAGNIYEHLREVTAISRESQWVHGQICLPYLLLPELNVTAKG